MLTHLAVYVCIAWGYWAIVRWYTVKPALFVSATHALVSFTLSSYILISRFFNPGRYPGIGEPYTSPQTCNAVSIKEAWVNKAGPGWDISWLWSNEGLDMELLRPCLLPIAQGGHVYILVLANLISLSYFVYDTFWACTIHREFVPHHLLCIYNFVNMLFIQQRGLINGMLCIWIAELGGLAFQHFRYFPSNFSWQAFKICFAGSRLFVWPIYWMIMVYITFQQVSDGVYTFNMGLTHALGETALYAINLYWLKKKLFSGAPEPILEAQQKRNAEQFPHGERKIGHQAKPGSANYRFVSKKNRKKK